MVRIFIGCLLVPFFISCSSSQQEGIISNKLNKDSELTLLMRKMYNDADTIKQHIKAGTGTITEEFIKELAYIHNATPSDPKLSNPTFTAFNNLILTEAKTLQTSSENKVEGFNELVNRCIDCHKTFCPGPITRIKKLKIN